MKYVLLDKNGKIRCVMRPRRMYEDARVEQILEFDNYEEALAYAKEEGNMDVAELHVVTRVRTTMHKHQTIDYCLEN